MHPRKKFLYSHKIKCALLNFVLIFATATEEDTTYKTPFSLVVDLEDLLKIKKIKYLIEDLL
jgi:hypothetical protein